MRIALIEDRLGRLEQFGGADLQSHPSVKVITGLEFDDFMVAFGKGDMRSLDDFACIASHRSALPNNVRDAIKDYCKSNRKPLVFFSGGISSSVYNDREFPFLHINARDFYSSNLTLFLEDFVESNPPNLLKFQFGERWKLTILLRLRNDIAAYLNKLEIQKHYRGSEIKPLTLSKLSINAILRPDLVTDRTHDMLSGNEYLPIPSAKLKELEGVIKRAIIESV